MGHSPAPPADDERVPAIRVHLICGVLILTFFLIDLLVPLGVAIGVLYIIPIMLSMWTSRREATLILAIVTSLLVLAGYLFSPPGPSAWQSIINRGLSLLAVWVTAALVAQRQSMEVRRERAVRAREQALNEIKILRGFLPICSNCKRIRDDDGYWQQVEAYICEHSEAQFSHSICRECAMKLYPDLYGEERGSTVEAALAKASTGCPPAREVARRSK